LVPIARLNRLRRIVVIRLRRRIVATILVLRLGRRVASRVVAWVL
jgi:hypothetical protein